MMPVDKARASSVRRTTTATLAALLIVAATATQQALAASSSAAAAPAHSGAKKGGKSKYDKSICDFTTGTCKLATQAQLAAVAERTDCDVLASPSDKGGCGLTTREELSEFESETVDVTTALALEINDLQAAVRSLTAAFSLMATELPANLPVPPPTSTDPLCTRRLEYDGAAAPPPFSNTGYTVWHVIPTTGGTISCNNAARDAFTKAVVLEAPKPDNCPLVPNVKAGGEYNKIKVQGFDCEDKRGPPGKNVFYQLTMTWQTNFPCPSSPFQRLTSNPMAPAGTELSTFDDGCRSDKGCDPCRPAAVAGHPDGKAICDAIYSAYPAGTVRVVESLSYTLRQSYCPECVRAGDPYCSPDGRDPFFVGV